MNNNVSNASSGVYRKEIEEMVREEFEEKQRREVRSSILCVFGLEESSILNAEIKKEDETNVTNIMQEVLGDDEDFRTSISKMLRIGRPVLQPVLQENQEKPVDSLGGAAPVANERNDQ